MRNPGQTLGLFVVGGALGLVAMACDKPGDEANEQPATSTDALSATAQCVRQASDAELIAELQARLAAGSSGSVPPTESASATYTCDSSGYLTIAIIKPNGSESTDRNYLGNSDNCHVFADQLNETRQSFPHTSIFAICDTSGYLQRFSVTTAGVMTKLDRQYLGSFDNCKSQAATINH